MDSTLVRLAEHVIFGGPLWDYKGKQGVSGGYIHPPIVTPTAQVAHHGARNPLARISASAHSPSW